MDIHLRCREVLDTPFMDICRLITTGSCICKLNRKTLLSFRRRATKSAATEHAIPILEVAFSNRRWWAMLASLPAALYEPWLEYQKSRVQPCIVFIHWCRACMALCTVLIHRFRACMQSLNLAVERDFVCDWCMSHRRLRVCVSCVYAVTDQKTRVSKLSPFEFSNIRLPNSNKHVLTNQYHFDATSMLDV